MLVDVLRPFVKTGVLAESSRSVIAVIIAGVASSPSSDRKRSLLFPADMAMYSASVVERATTGCRREAHPTADSPMQVTVPIWQRPSSPP